MSQCTESARCQAKLRPIVAFFLGDDAFAPVPNRLSLFFEYQQDARQPWLPLRLTSLGVIQPEGPYVHQVEVLESIATKELRMRLLDWPIYYTVDLQKIATSNQYGRMAKSRGAFRNAIVISGLHELESNMIVKLLASHMSHHIPMGFDVYLLYARGSDLLKAILANDVTSSFVDNGSLQVVLLDSLQLPAYDDRRTNTAHPFHISYDAMKLIAYNHAALMLWGERFRLAVMDLDEFWSPHPSHSLVNSWFDTCYAGADVLMSERVDVVCNRTAPRYSVTEMNYFQSHWNASGPTDVLKRFSKVASFSQDPKSIFWPDKVGQVWLHKPESLPGSKVTKVTINNGRIHEPNCVFIVHLYNLFKTRIPEDSITLFDLKW